MVGRAFRVPVRLFPKASPSVRESPFFLLKYHKNKLSHNRYAVIVGTLVDRRSVRRHHIKRFFLRKMASWPNRNTDFLAIVAPKANSFDTVSLTHKLESAFRRAEKDLI